MLFSDSHNEEAGKQPTCRFLNQSLRLRFRLLTVFPAFKKTPGLVTIIRRYHHFSGAIVTVFFCITAAAFADCAGFRWSDHKKLFPSCITRVMRFGAWR